MCKKCRSLFHDYHEEAVEIICKFQVVKKKCGCRKKQDKQMVCKCKEVDHCSCSHCRKHDKRFVCKCKLVKEWHDHCCCHSCEREEFIIWDY